MVSVTLRRCLGNNVVGLCEPVYPTSATPTMRRPTALERGATLMLGKKHTRSSHLETHGLAPTSTSLRGMIDIATEVL